MSSRRPMIVVGYNGSDASRCAVAVAARRAGPKGIVYIVEAYQSGRGSGAGDELDAERQHAQALLDAVLLVGDDELLDTEYETAAVAGPAASAIAGVARPRDADEIVVGAAGSVASRRCWAASRTSSCTSPTGRCS